MRNAARRTLFQPEAPPARIQILGMLEAAGLDFDALWIAGLSAEQWPPPAHPTPLLPIAWQRERGVPRADAGRALAYARTLTEVFARAADDVVASHAAQTDGQTRAGSALVSAWPAVTFADADRRRGRAAQVAAEPVLLELLPDEFAPALPAGAVVRGGVDTIESQSTCPFQAFARHRLAVRSASAAANGLSPEERGILLHRSLAAFWGDVRDSAALRTLDDAALCARIAQAVQAALGDFDARRWRSLPAPVAQAESLRLAGTLQAWLTSVERERAPFTVAFMEAPSRLAIGGIELAFRVDRVDALAAGGVAIIDYKSGHAPPPSKWFGARPAGTQVGLYALAQRVRAPGEPVRAVAYAELKAGEVKVNGLAANGDVWPGLRVPGGKKVPVADWAEVEPAWRERYGAVAASFAQGHAMVAPRDADGLPLVRHAAAVPHPAARRHGDGARRGERR